MAALKFASNGKRDIHGVEEAFDKAFLTLQQRETWCFEKNRKVVIEYLQACLLGEAKSNGRNKKITRAWLYRVMGQLRKLSEEWLKRGFDNATFEDWHEFYRRLELDEIRKESGERYSAATKSKIYKIIRKFAKWRYGNNKNYPDFCESWVTTEPIVTRPYLTRSEVGRLAGCLERHGIILIRVSVITLIIVWEIRQPHVRVSVIREHHPAIPPITERRSPGFQILPMFREPS